MDSFNIDMPGGTLGITWQAQDIPEPGPAPTTIYASRARYVEDHITNPEQADQTAAFQAACTAAGNAGGGTVFFIGNYQISGSLHIPERVQLVGPCRSSGKVNHLGPGSGGYGNKLGVLKVSSLASIYIGASASISNCSIIRSGLTLPFASASEALAGINAFTGTALRVNGDDAQASNLLILGFAYALQSHGYARHRLIDISGDCTNGIRISECRDVPYIVRCHFWPFTTANYTWTASDPTQRILTRYGVGFELADTVDWAKLTNCFTFGYFRGYRLSNVHATVLTACSADNPVLNSIPTVTGTIGILVEGNSLDSKITDFTAAGASQGIFLGAVEGSFTEVTGSNTVACTMGINVRSGDVQIIGGLDRAASIGLQVQSATSKVTIMRKMRQVSTPTNLFAPDNVTIIGSLV